MSRDRLSDYTIEELKHAFGRVLTREGLVWESLRKDDLIDCIMIIHIDERLHLLEERSRPNRAQPDRQVQAPRAEQQRAPIVIQQANVMHVNQPLRPVHPNRQNRPNRVLVPRIVTMDQPRPIREPYERAHTPQEEHTENAVVYMHEYRMAGVRRNRDDAF
jgi:hypothetical protein